MKSHWWFVLILAPAMLALGACAQGPRVTPFTISLFQQLELDNSNVQAIQVYYRAKRREMDMPRTRDTRFHYVEKREKLSRALGKKPLVEKDTTITREDIILYDGTPGIIVNVDKTRRKSYVLRVDFGDDILLEFENNRPDGIFYLVTDRILLEDQAYVLESRYYGYLVVNIQQRSRTRTEHTVYEIRGKVLE